MRFQWLRTASLLQYASQKALARLIDKDTIYIRRHEIALSKGGTLFEKIEAQILTAGGLQGGTIYGEDFIYSLLGRHKPDLLEQTVITPLPLNLAHRT